MSSIITKTKLAFASALLAVAFALLAPMAAFAADGQISVTAPSEITGSVQADGSIVYPTDAGIENGSAFGIKVAEVKVGSVGSDFSLVAESAFNGSNADNKIWTTVNGIDLAGCVSAAYEPATDWIIDASTSDVLELSGKMGNITVTGLSEKMSFATVSWTFAPDAITGTVSVSGTVDGVPYVGEELTASAADLPEGITAKYTWYVGDAEGELATKVQEDSATWTPTEAYVGKYVTVVAEDADGNLPGTLTCSIAMAVTKTPAYALILSNPSATDGDTVPMVFIRAAKAPTTYDGLAVTAAYTGFEDDGRYIGGENTPWAEHRGSVTSARFDDVVKPANTDSWFAGMTNLADVSLANLDTSNAYAIHGMFQDCSSLEHVDVSGMVTSSVKLMGYAFDGCTSLTSLDLSNWDTSKASHFTSIFQDCSSLESINLSGWDVSGATYVMDMFSGCSTLKELDLSSFDTKNAKYLNRMFAGMTSLEKITLGASFSFLGSGTNPAVLPTPSETYIDGADGNWYNIDTLDGYSPEALRDAYDGAAMAGTYTAIAPRITGAVTVTGEYVVGKTLTVAVTDLPDGVTPKVQWYAGSAQGERTEPLDTGSSLSLTDDVKSKYITVVVTDDTGTYAGELVFGGEEVLSLEDYLASTTAYAIIADDGSGRDTYAMMFVRAASDSAPQVGGTYDGAGIKRVYSGFEDVEYEGWGGVEAPWFTDAEPLYSNVTSVTFVDYVRPISTAQWFATFHGLSTIEGLDYLNTSKARNMRMMFTGIGPDELDLSSFDTSNVTDMHGMFAETNTEIILGPGWVTSNVTDMASMFFMCNTTKLDLSAFDTSSLTDTDYMFQDMAYLQEITFGENWTWVGDEGYLPDQTGLVDGADGKWYASDGTGYACDGVPDGAGTYYASKEAYLNSTIAYAAVYNGDTLVFGRSSDGKAPATYTSDAGVNLALTEGAEWVGIETLVIEELSEIPWYDYRSAITSVDFADIVKPQSTAWWFAGMSSCMEMNLSKLDTSKVVSMESMFSGCSTLTMLDVTGFDTSNVTDMSYMLENCSALSTIYASDLWNTDAVMSSSNMFSGCTSLKGNPGISYSEAKIDATYATTDGTGYLTSPAYALILDNSTAMAEASLLAEGDSASYVGSTPMVFIRSASTPEVGETYNGRPITAVYSGSNDTGFEVATYTVLRNDEGVLTGTTAPWCTDGRYESVTSVAFEDNVQPISTACWFTNMANCSEITGLQNLNTSKTEDMKAMFYNCSGVSALDVSGFETGNVTDMSYMFSGCSGVSALDVSGFETGNVGNMKAMFQTCSSLTSLDVSGFETGNVTDMSYMFYNCSGVSALDVSGFETGNVGNMKSMFYKCSGVSALDVSGFETGNVTDMSFMFNNCSGVSALDVSGFETGNVGNMSSMFYNCSGVSALDVSGFETGNVGNMKSMFYNCSGVSALDVSGFETGNVTDMSTMFYNCSGVSALDVSGFETGNVTTMSSMFRGCTALTTTGNLSGWDTSKVTLMQQMFYDCSYLTSVGDISGWNTAIVTNMSYMFRGCSRLSANCANWNTSSISGSTYYKYFNYSASGVIEPTAFTGGTGIY